MNKSLGVKNNTYAMGTENSVLKYNTLARTGGFAGWTQEVAHQLLVNLSMDKLNNYFYVTFSTEVTDPSFIVKISERDNDWDVSPCFRKAAPCSSRSLAILSYNFDLLSVFEIVESNSGPLKLSMNSQSKPLLETHPYMHVHKYLQQNHMIE